MSGTHRGVCQLCPEVVIWAVTPKGHRMPVDAAPAANGNVHLEYREANPPLATVVHRDPVAPRTDLHLAHFVTCQGNVSKDRRK